jgi:hypothetical protein
MRAGRSTLAWGFIRQTILTIILVLLSAVPFLSWRAAKGMPIPVPAAEPAILGAQGDASEKSTAEDLLAKYAAHRDRLTSFIARTEGISHLAVRDAQGTKETTTKRLVEFRYENTHGAASMYYGRKEFRPAEDGAWIAADDSHAFLWDRKRYYEYRKAPSLDSSRVYVADETDFTKYGIATLYEGAGPLLGVLFGDADRLDTVLKQANALTLRAARERVGSADCYVLDAHSRHGTYTVWLDPEHGYGIAKATVHKGPQDLRYGRSRDSYTVVDDEEDSSLENVRFEQIEGLWVPAEADLRSADKYPDRTVSFQGHYKMTHLDINPDHIALRSFVPEIESGTPVKLEEVPGIECIWRDGRIVVADNAGYVELEEWKARRADASSVLASAFEQAQKQDKNVFLLTVSASCPWCRRMDDFLGSCKVAPIIDRDFIIVRLDPARMKGVGELIRKYRGGGDLESTPWFAFLSKTGSPLATSTTAAGENIGFPGDPQTGIPHFVHMLEQARHRITEEEIASVRDELTEIARHLQKDN